MSLIIPFFDIYLRAVSVFDHKGAILFDSSQLDKIRTLSIMLTKTPSPTNQYENRKRKLSDTDLDETPTDPKELKKWRKKHRRERKKMYKEEAKQPKHYILNFGFYGEILIQPKDIAIAYAMDALQSNYHQSPSQNTQNNVFWVDGSLPTGAAGAAVVYKDTASTESTEWIDHGFCISDMYDINFVELFAIGTALKIGISQIGKHGSSLPAPQNTIKIFSDSTGAMALIEIYSRTPGKLASLGIMPVVQKVFELSRQLHQMGATIKIHWDPGHSNIPAHDRADLVAKAAATYPSTSASEVHNKNWFSSRIRVADCSFLDSSCSLDTLCLTPEIGTGPVLCE